MITFERPTWIDRAACRGMSPSTFVPDQAGNGIRYRSRITPPPEVAACCAQCPVTEDCLKLGIETGSSGFFGGVFVKYGRPIPTEPMTKSA